MVNANKGRKRVFFRLTAPNAAEVSVGGSFNDWNAKKHVLKRKPGGFWEKAMMLPPGRHEYKFLVDGKWWLDPSNGQSCDDGLGGLNSVIEVGPRAAAGRKKGMRPQA